MSYLVVEKLNRKYGDVTALTNFSLEVAQGEIVALVGPDGAGKTTTIRIVCGLLDADSGQVTISGHDIFTSFDTIKPQLGYMPQQFSLYQDLSVEENLSFYAGLYGLTGNPYREKRDFLYKFSNLAPFASRRAAALSGGMKQKLALSCALIHEPRFLVLDEPTTGVDPLSRRQFWDILLKFRTQGVTILASTPYMDEVARCDRACFMFNGRKLSEGAPSELAGQFQGHIYYLDCEPTSDLVTNLNRIESLAARRFGAGLHICLPEDDTLDNYSEQLHNLGIDASKATAIAPDLEDRFIQLIERPS